MVIVTEASDVPRINNSAIRKLVELRFQQLALDSSHPTPGKFIVVEGGEAISAIEQAAGLPILTGLFDDLAYTDPDFQPCSEILEEHRNEHSCIYEMVFISSDDGAFTSLLIPDNEDVDTDLLAMCRSWATPAVSRS